MILTFDMSTIATMATTVAIMAAYFVMEIYWAGTQGLAFSTNNIFYGHFYSCAVSLQLLLCADADGGLLPQKSSGIAKGRASEKDEDAIKKLPKGVFYWH